MQTLPERRLTEARLIELARDDSREAIGLLYERHGASLVRLAARITGSTADGQDVVHDLFIGLPELLRRYEHQDNLEAWLKVVVVRLALMRLRTVRRRREVGNDDDLRAVTLTTDPWNAVDLERAIARLSDDDRTVFALKQLEGYSHAEIAQLLDISSGASRVRFLRALRRLRRLLEPNT